MTETELTKFVTRTACPRKFARLDLDGMRHGGAGNYLAALDQIAVIGEALLCRRYLTDPVFLLLSGPFGSGKTRAACWLLLQAYLGAIDGRCPPGFAPLFIRVPQLADLRFRALGDGREDEDEDHRAALRDRLSDCALLVIDDVARVAGYRGEEQYVENIVERRWEDERSIILTGNVDGEADASGKRLPGLSPRFRDFLRYFEVIALTGETRRGT
jgi:hypothetical protein